MCQYVLSYFYMFNSALGFTLLRFKSDEKENQHGIASMFDVNVISVMNS